MASLRVVLRDWGQLSTKAYLSTWIGLNSRGPVTTPTISKVKLIAVIQHCIIHNAVLTLIHRMQHSYAHFYGVNFWYKIAVKTTYRRLICSWRLYNDESLVPSNPQIRQIISKNEKFKVPRNSQTGALHRGLQECWVQKRTLFRARTTPSLCFGLIIVRGKANTELAVGWIFGNIQSCASTPYNIDNQCDVDSTFRSWVKEKIWTKNKTREFSSTCGQTALYKRVVLTFFMWTELAV